jgi:hypothetical protein
MRIIALQQLPKKKMMLGQRVEIDFVEQRKTKRNVEKDALGKTEKRKIVVAVAMRSLVLLVVPVLLVGVEVVLTLVVQVVALIPAEASVEETLAVEELLVAGNSDR